MKVRATFVGKQGSLGYQTGHTYNLTIKGNDVRQPGFCPYSSVETFLKNWNIIEVVEK